jgi:hypothetical protein
LRHTNVSISSRRFLEMRFWSSRPCSCIELALLVDC